MKKSILLFALTCLGAGVLAQSPYKFNYQGVARTGSGAAIPNQMVTLRASILDGSAFGLSQYVEKQEVSTNQFGLFTAAIGGGTAITGSFENITWGNGEKYMKIEIDPLGGENYSLVGVFQLLSVPYAINSKNAEALQGNPVTKSNPENGQVLRWDDVEGAWKPTDPVQSVTYSAGAGIAIDPGNHILNTAPDQPILIMGSGSTTVSGSYPNFIVNTPAPPDNSPTNEIQTLSIIGNTLTLSNGGGFVTFPAEVDGSVTNEIQTLSLTGNNLSLTNGGGTVTLPSGTNYTAGAGINISGNSISNTGDLSVTNEIQTLSLTGNTLSLTNGGGTVTLPSGTNYTAGTGINIDGSNKIINTGDTNSADDITTATVSGGDISGNFSTVIVDGIQGKPVAPTAPSNGQVLKWNGTAWSPATIATNETYNIGDLAFGGMVFWVEPSGSHGLVVSTQNVNINPLVYFATSFTYGDGIYAGERNTGFLIHSTGWIDQTNPVVVCARYQGGNYGDWYLPSKYELNLVYTNLKLAGLGGLGNYNYWTSSGYLGDTTWYQNFGNGQPGYDFSQQVSANVRAVRRF